MEVCINSDCPNIKSRWCWACQYYVPIVVPDPTPEPAWQKSQWDKVQQLQSEVVGWRQKHSEMMLELDKMRKPKRKLKYD